jgi:predicted nuclease with RNAse H fold
LLSAGVDVSENRGLDVVILDAARRLACPPLRRLSPVDLRDVLRSETEIGVVAIDSPPGPGRDGPTRRCEQAMRALGIKIFSTPADPQRFARPFYNWIRIGQQAFAAAADAGFALLGATEVDKRVDAFRGRALEVFPHATDVFLRGHLPPAGVTRSPLMKKRWRSETLARSGVVEIDRLTTPDAVDAALAALTGLYFLEGTFEGLGEAPDLIIVPSVPPKRPIP